MPTPPGRSIAFAALAGGSGVVSGALGAHALRPTLEAAGRVAVWDTAVHYHLLHAVALLAVALYLRGETEPRIRRALALAGDLFAGGIVLFSGSLYALSFGAPRWLGRVTPLGGLCLIAGWLLVGLAFRPRRS